ncbi:SGNH hydrolase-type esterase domain-containing protein [Protomyces lactucae-debilis]|uniref:SGNH hydrolase-type esterase domain-containing protein n=1 Tax=Protomyces lactucae-debilis TaxID=2754530 RepID=A0A1Y2FF72_PROLT|nr:SGNH hydrolase-type esterase domain-containing protein [Protomyces lactucae-debilis]ORY81946.1 SGNH hydrolase-type esterase domain-containing protein [Protomyces lactucae-debilis]
MLFLLPLLGVALAESHTGYAGYTFVVLGDSEIAPGSGYGDCLNEVLPGAEVLNFAVSGFSTVRYLKNNTHRALVKKGALEAKNRHQTVICSQAFGNIDEKRGTDYFVPPKEFISNMKEIHKELESVCTRAIFSTPFARRYYYENGTFLENGLEYVDLGKQAARETSSVLVDLHLVSESHLRTWSSDRAYKMNKTPTDYTHLNRYGCQHTALWWVTQFKRVFKDLDTPPVHAKRRHHHAA